MSYIVSSNEDCPFQKFKIAPRVLHHIIKRLNQKFFSHLHHVYDCYEILMTYKERETKKVHNQNLGSYD
jgi:hypothetical protein